MKNVLKLAAVTLPLALGLYSGVVNATNVDLGTLVSGDNGPFYEIETGAFNDKYDFAISFPSAGVNIQYNDLLVGNNHSIPNLAATLYNSAHFNLGALTGGNADNNFSLSNGSYYLQVMGNTFQNKAAVFGVHFQVTPVPEAETYSMMLAGLGLMGFIARRRKTELNA